jgi:hypothetical protein
MVIHGRTGSRPVGSSSIIGVFPICDGIKLMAVGHLILDLAEELVLAEETTIRSVRLIFGAITFVRLDLDERYAHLARDIMGRSAFLGSKAW